MSGKRSYARLGVEEFGAELLRSKDLDPVYVALTSRAWEGLSDPKDRRDRWLVAYWCLYHCGAASYLSEFKEEEFWERLHVAAANSAAAPTGERWPRGHERRHFRGAQALKAVAELRERYPEPEGFVAYVSGMDQPVTEQLSCAGVSKRVLEHRLFGPWIAFKVADMVDRVLGWNVSFEEAEVFLFDQPRQAAIELWRQRSTAAIQARAGVAAATGIDPNSVVLGFKSEERVIREVVAHLRKHFAGHLAPPANDRPVGLQEIETILCKWKSHVNGHYPLRNDIDEIRSGLAPWSRVCETANVFLAGMPE